MATPIRASVILVSFWLLTVELFLCQPILSRSQEHLLFSKNCLASWHSLPWFPLPCLFFVKSQIVDIFVCCCFQIICCVFCVYIFLSLCWIHSKSGQNRIVKRLHQLGEITQFQTKKSPKHKLTERTQKHFSIFFSDLDFGHRTSISPPEIYIYSCSICSQL